MSKLINWFSPVIIPSEYGYTPILESETGYIKDTNFLAQSLPFDSVGSPDKDDARIQITYNYGNEDGSNCDDNNYYTSILYEDGFDIRRNLQDW